MDETVKTRTRELARVRLREGVVNCGVPHHLQDGLIEYAMEGRPLGGFLHAFLANDLMAAVGKADPLSLAAFRGLRDFVMGYLNVACCGSYENVTSWTGRAPTEKQVAGHG